MYTTIYTEYLKVLQTSSRVLESLLVKTIKIEWVKTSFITNSFMCHTLFMKDIKNTFHNLQINLAIVVFLFTSFIITYSVLLTIYIYVCIVALNSNI